MADPLANHVEVIPATRAAWPWVLDSFRRELWGIDGGPRELDREQADALSRMLRGGLVRCALAVPVGHPDCFVGWAAEHGGALLYVYVRSRLRRQGIGAKLMCALTEAAPIGVAYWTAEAEAIARHGFPLVYSIDAYRALVAYSRPAQFHNERKVA